MSEPKFTPGPWWVLHEGSSEVSVQTDGACICSLNYDPLPKEEVQKHLANARLIAAAPELYDACVEAVYHICFDCMGGFRHDIGLTSEDLLNDGCPKKSNDCFFLKTLDLLRKVRDDK